MDIKVNGMINKRLHNETIELTMRKFYQYIMAEKKCKKRRVLRLES